MNNPFLSWFRIRPVPLDPPWSDGYSRLDRMDGLGVDTSHDEVVSVLIGTDRLDLPWPGDDEPIYRAALAAVGSR